MQNPDVIIVGAGHNGLATGALLAKRGLRVLTLEKNRYVGGMAGTREILKGCRNDVGASLLFPLAREVTEELELERYGVETLELPVMSCSVADPGDPPLVFYANPLRMALGVWRDFGTRALIGFAKLVAFSRYPAKVIARYEACTKPRDLEELLAEAPSPRAREQLELTFRGSAMDLIDRFFPDKVRHRPLRAQLAFAAVQSTYKGPFTPGSAFCLVYTLSPNDAGGLMKRVRGGMGSLSEALQRSIEDKGGEVRLGTSVKRILVEGGRAVGVELRGGEEIRARVVISNLDKPATFFGLVGEEQLPAETVNRIRGIEQQGAYVHLLFKLSALPRFGPPFEHLNANPGTRFNLGLFTNPEELQASYEACVRGELPRNPPAALQIPTVVDPTLAPEGCHLGTTYGFYFPCEAPKEVRGKLRDEMAERIIDRVEAVYPGFRELIVDSAVFSSDHFATMQGATGGDFTHGMIHPDQMLGARTLVPGSSHRTPIENLYLCGASCHPGPGVTFLPGYGCAAEVIESMGAAAESGGSGS
ncbi:MAG: NAD(P)/FAD-dependent oxidoreductase [Deltaproteobacteria bacterium]|nr:NAD(P)/FAD-dependent oxidoreductase [Deltaproteobacteria bacterium]